MFFWDRFAYHCWVLEVTRWLTLLSVYQRGKFRGVSNLKYWLNSHQIRKRRISNSITQKRQDTYSAKKDPIEITLFGVQLEGKSSCISDTVCRASFTCDCRESSEERSLLAHLVKKIQTGDVRNIMSNLEFSECTRTFGMDKSIENSEVRRYNSNCLNAIIKGGKNTFQGYVHELYVR